MTDGSPILLVLKHFVGQSCQNIGLQCDEVQPIQLLKLGLRP